MDDANFDQFIDLIRGENEEYPFANFSPRGYGFDQHNNIGGACSADGPLFSPTPPVHLFNFNTESDNAANVNMKSCGVVSESLKEEMKQKVEETMDEDREQSSATNQTNMSSNKSNIMVDRLKTLASDRKRRSRMKDKLYALRSLVPNITKMDKASIVGDAVLYVQDLQMRAAKLKAEIATVESLIGEHKGRTNQISKKSNAASFSPIIKKIIKMDASAVEEGGFYVRVVSNKGNGVATSLYKALESFTPFNIQSSNLAASAENYIFTFTLHVIKCEMDVSITILKQWIANVFLNQGFAFETSTSHT